MPLTKHESLTILELAGSPEDMGREQGIVFRDMIQDDVRNFLQRNRDEFDMPEAFLTEMIHKAEPFIPEPFLREMATLAEYAGVAFEEILILNCLADIHNCANLEVAQCCNFVVFDAATSDGVLMHGRNLDFPHFNIITKVSVVTARKPSEMGRLPTLSIGWAGYVGMLTGMNSRQITAAEVSSLAKDSGMDGMPISFLLRDCLERSHSLPEATAIIRDAPRTSGFNLALSDAKAREAIAIEFTRSLCETRRPRKNVLVVDDPCFCPGTARERTGYLWGAFRHARIMELIHQHRGEIDVPLALEFLQDRYDIAFAVSRGRGYRCICNHETVQSALFLPELDTVYVAMGSVPAPRGGYEKIDTRALLTSHDGSAKLPSQKQT